MIRKCFSKNRKAQITVFMIIGIILLFSTAFIFYIRARIAEAPGEFKPVVEEVPVEAEPIKIYVEQCMNEIVTEGVKQIGLHGGYINLRDEELSGTEFRADLVPTESEILYYPGLEEIGGGIPYWFYLESDNECSDTCIFATKQPALYKDTGGLNAIENQLDRYVQRELEQCLADFAVFRDQGFEFTINGPIEPDVRATQRDVAVFLKYPITASRDDTKIDINEYFTRVDVNLARVYALASDITDSEVEFSFIEEQVMNLIVAQSHPLSASKLPPIGDAKFDAGDYVIWTLFETKQKIENLVLPQINLLQVGGIANNNRRIIYSGETGEYDALSTALMDLTVVFLNSTTTYPDLFVDFMYLDWWPIYLNINNQQVLQPTSVLSEYLSFIMPSIYRFFYDVSFPVLVKVSDPAAFNGRGYDFYFALEGNIRDNDIMNLSFSRITPGIDQRSMVCEPGQRTSGLIKLNTINKYTQTPVEDVRVDFVLGDEFCHIGMTKLEEEGTEAVVIDNFPVGSGQIRLYKQGYAPFQSAFGAFEEIPVNFTAELVPEVTINATVKIKRLTYVTDGKYEMIDPANPLAVGSLDKSRTAILRFKRIDDDEYFGYQSFFLFNGTSIDSNVQLIPGTYDVRGDLINSKGHKIGDTFLTYSIPFKGPQKQKINGTEFDNWIEGGIQTEITIPEKELLTSKSIVFYVLSFPKPSVPTKEIADESDLAQLGLKDEYSELYKEELQPKFID